MNIVLLFTGPLRSLHPKIFPSKQTSTLHHFFRTSAAVLATKCNIFFHPPGHYYIFGIFSNLTQNEITRQTHFRHESLEDGCFFCSALCSWFAQTFKNAPQTAASREPLFCDLWTHFIAPTQTTQPSQRV